MSLTYTEIELVSQGVRESGSVLVLYCESAVAVGRDLTTIREK